MTNTHIEDMRRKYSECEHYESEVYNLDSSRIKKVLDIINSLKKGNLLEIGCLSGKTLSTLQKNNWKCYGLDIIDKPKNFNDKIIFKRHNVEEDLPFENDFFDVIYIGEVIEHIYDTDHFLLEINRILKIDGFAIITTPNIASFVNRFLLLMGKYPRYMEYKKGDAGHIHLYTLKILENQLNNNGFKVEKKVGNFFSFPDPTNGKKIRKSILSLLGNYFPTFSENLIIAARKEKYLAHGY